MFEWRKRRLQHEERLQHEDEAVKDLVHETEAFLTGRYSEVTGGVEQSPAPWVELNWIAHAPAHEVRSSLCHPAAADTPWGGWAWAVASLAKELIADARDDPERIHSLQVGCLVPLELTLMAQPFRPVSPVEVVASGVTRLRAHPRVRGSGDTR